MTKDEFVAFLAGAALVTAVVLFWAGCQRGDEASGQGDGSEERNARDPSIPPLQNVPVRGG